MKLSYIYRNNFSHKCTGNNEIQNVTDGEDTDGEDTDGANMKSMSTVQ